MAMKKCIMCGKMFDPDQIVVESKNPFLDDDDEDMPKKTPSFCQMCEAKIRHEADDTRKGTKPM
ncbi:hypothetical protein SPSYN_02441 [Sporotomaculum syntrophicum]|uniref:DUF2197 domain-containing protein n=1 Tax=Sporotomaculum syntrophicum TaxID=182264 RepID=A0A9D2WPF2_9FIRM|nr:hypothetical protein [Sporotomaculum syntrophicum]KAF1084663.1 hypothetical protein SPSYN_02441 [Sporotomaculum syntrophicum]